MHSIAYHGPFCSVPPRTILWFLGPFAALQLARLEAENSSLRDVTRRLELDLQEMKNISLLPCSGAELEVMLGRSVHLYDWIASRRAREAYLVLRPASGE